MANVKHTDAVTLKAWLDQGLNLTVVDVLPPEYFAAAHIPGARNFCVYKVTFLADLRQALPETDRLIVLCGASKHCHSAQDAAGKLMDAHYEDVTICDDGLEGWKAAGLSLEGDGSQEPFSPLDLGSGSFALGIDPHESRVRWFGRSRTVHHHGTIPVDKGELRFKDGRLDFGFFELDMTGLSNENLQDASLAGMLVAHLRSRDFFLTDVFPVARFETTHVTTVFGKSSGEPNFEVDGQLTVRGITRGLTFPATVERLDDGRVVAEAHFDLDRTCFGVNYGSGRFFEKLGMHLVHDLVSVQLRVVSDRAVPS